MAVRAVRTRADSGYRAERIPDPDFRTNRTRGKQCPEPARALTARTAIRACLGLSVFILFKKMRLSSRKALKTVPP